MNNHQKQTKALQRVMCTATATIFISVHLISDDLQSQLKLKVFKKGHDMDTNIAGGSRNISGNTSVAKAMNGKH